MSDAIHADVCYAPDLRHWITGEQAAQHFGPLHRDAPTVLHDLAVAGVIHRQWVYGLSYYRRDDVALVAAAIAWRTTRHRIRRRS